MSLTRWSGRGSLLVFLACLGQGGAGHAGAAEQFDISRFVTPVGWELDQTKAPGWVTIKRVEPDRYCMIVIYSSRPTSGDPAVDFRTEWNEIVGTLMPGSVAPQPVLRRLGSGVEAMAGEGDVTYSGGGRSDNPAHPQLLVLRAGARYLPVDILTATRETFDAHYRETVEAFLAGIVLETGTAAPPSSGASMPPAPSQSIGVADLAGRWEESVGLYDRQNRAAGGGFSYTLSADGTYTYKYTGFSGSTRIREKDSGTFGVADGFLFFQGRELGTRRYRILGWKQAADGTPILSLLQESYQPTESNVGMYSESWSRVAQ